MVDVQGLQILNVFIVGQVCWPLLLKDEVIDGMCVGCWVEEKATALCIT